MTMTEPEPTTPQATDTHEITLTVNGTKHQLAVEGRRLLVDVLRQDLWLTGTHAACDQGVCGA
jgi:carbon-monoxide dehydrogenase small subunit